MPTVKYSKLKSHKIKSIPVQQAAKHITSTAQLFSILSLMTSDFYQVQRQDSPPQEKEAI